MAVKKVVLAYSGGLDTSIIIPWIKEHYDGAEIIAYCGDVGQGDDLEAVRKKALATGASECVVEDLREEFVRDFAFKALAAGAVYEDNYLLGTALARPLLAYRQAQVALARGADALSHGATGKGNDQVRFEVTCAAFAPHLKVIAPWREWDIRSREDALEYAAARNIPVDQSPRDIFSRDGNLWHLSHEGGNLEDPWDAPRKEMFKLTVAPEDAPGQGGGGHDRLRARRARVPRRRAARARWSMVTTLNTIAGRHGVGRLDLVENRLVGIKSRGVYETPAGTVLLPRPPRAGAPRARPRHPALQAVGLRPLRPAHLRRPVVLHPARGPGRLRGLHRAGGHGRGAGAALQGPGRGRRTPLAAQPVPPGPGHLRRRHGLRPRRRRAASSASSACPSACAR